mmetsp:Transcript_31318/g.89429  ORF Transcript_31318/g.89429 Transcript_31318/m.89429 type:complete len:236 (+) Transcript_31318:934-1641(+)
MHRVEIQTPHASVHRHLRNCDREDVEKDDQQAHDVKHRFRRGRHALHQNHQLWKGAEQPHHPRQAQEPEESQYPCASGKTLCPTSDQDDDGEEPSLRYHQSHQQAIKDEPSITQAIPLPLERHASNEPLEREEGAEEVVDRLEYRRRAHRVLRVRVEVRVDGDPQRVDADDDQCRVVEVPVARDGLPEAGPLVVLADTVLRLADGLADLPLHLLLVHPRALLAAVPRDRLHGAGA